MRNASECTPDLGALQLKCTFLSLESPCATPTGYGQAFCQDISSKYSAEQQAQIDHDPTFAGKFFNNVGEEPVKVERGLSAQIKTDLFQLI